jgi:hypothetical protein
LAAITQRARRVGISRVQFKTLPYDHPVQQHLRRGTCRAETGYWRCAEAMVRTLNLPAALDKLSRELAARLKASPLATWRGTLLIRDAWEAAALKIDRGRVAVAAPGRSRHAIRGGEQVAQLLIGTDEPDEIVAAAGMRLSGDARHLIRVLFPNQHPTLSAWDRY